MIRRLLPILAVLALAHGFVLAPYQHVHPGSGHETSGGRDEPTIVHAHLYAVSLPADDGDGPSVGRLRRHHSSVALDTFTTLAHSVPFLLLQTETSIQIVAPEKSDIEAEMPEPCGHDPPGLRNIAPRAPPV